MTRVTLSSRAYGMSDFFTSLKNITSFIFANIFCVSLNHACLCGVGVFGLRIGQASNSDTRLQVEITAASHSQFHKQISEYTLGFIRSTAPSKYKTQYLDEPDTTTVHSISINHYLSNRFCIFLYRLSNIRISPAQYPLIDCQTIYSSQFTICGLLEYRFSGSL